MDYKIQNDALTVTVSSMGAELMSVIKGGCEYIWQGDPEYWAGRSPNLFPICGRLTDGKYTYKGEIYEMMLHGFAKISEFEVFEQKEDKITFILKPNEEIKKMYPFDFEYYVEYTLIGNKLEMKYTAKNMGENTMYSAFGGHPGFCVPLDNGSFEDYYVEFKCVKPARKLVFEACFTTDDTVPFDLEDGKILRLQHNLFDNDAIFLQDMSKTVTLKSDKSTRSVTMCYPDMKYLGFWHKPESDAPYVCIEPWQSVPAYYNVVDDIETKRELFPLDKGEERSAQIDIIFE